MARVFLSTANQYVTVPSLPDITTKLTFSCWFRKSAIPTAGQFHNIFTKGNSGTSRNFDLDHRLRSGVEHLELSWTTAASTYAEYYAAVTLQIGRWYHVVCTIDWDASPDVVALYLDGVPLALTLTGSNDSAPYIAATQVSRIGNIHSSPSAGTRFQGDIAEAFLLSDTITPDQAFALATGCISPDDFGATWAREFYFPLLGTSPETDMWRGRDAAWSLTTDISDHPPTSFLEANTPFLRHGFLFGGDVQPAKSLLPRPSPLTALIVR